VYLYGNLVDVLILLPNDHPSLHLIKRIFSLLPPFDFRSPIFYSFDVMKKLHRDNLNLITNYLHRHTLFSPNVFSLSYFHPHNIHLLSTDTHPHMSSNHPLFRLKRLLDIYRLIMLPSDKSNTTLILDENVLFDEMRIHLSDDTTYKQLSNDEYVFYSDIQKTAVAEASKFYGINFAIPSPSQRYIYFLPKIHKDLSD
jgi:hypothetical protein